MKTFDVRAESAELLERDAQAMELGRICQKLGLTKASLVELRQNKAELWECRAALANLRLIVKRVNSALEDGVNMSEGR